MGQRLHEDGGAVQSFVAGLLRSLYRLETVPVIEKDVLARLASELLVLYRIYDVRPDGGREPLQQLKRLHSQDPMAWAELFLFLSGVYPESVLLLQAYSPFAGCILCFAFGNSLGRINCVGNARVAQELLELAIHDGQPPSPLEGFVFVVHMQAEEKTLVLRFPGNS
jgi:hypothetical protein